MNREDVLKLWSSSGGDNVRGMPYDIIEEFAKQVEDAAFARWAAHTKIAVMDEREACAKVCDAEIEEWGWDANVADVGRAIRERGQQ